VAWATDALQAFDTSVSALAHQLGVSWHTVWDAVRVEASRRIAATERLEGVDALGVDEHVWSHTGPPGSGMVTGIVDHTRDAHGVVHARLLDLIPGRSGKAYADWLKDRGAGSLPRDRLYGIRRTLQVGAEHLSEKQSARLDAKLIAGDPDHEVTLAWLCYQKLRNIYHARSDRGRELVNEVIASFPTCPIPEDPRRLQRAHRGGQWRHRNHPQHRPRLPELRELQTQMPTRRRRPPALPDQTD
jgi:hypothetical protein